nr:hypothetical protein [Actinoplanes subtropicus]
MPTFTSVTRTCEEEPAGRAQAPVAGAELAGADGLAGAVVVAVGVGALLLVPVLGSVLLLGDVVGPAGRLSRHCWFVWPLHVQWMMAAPFAVDRPVTSTQRPFCTFLSAYPLPDRVATNFCAAPPLQVATSRMGVSVDTPRQPPPLSGLIV